MNIVLEELIANNLDVEKTSKNLGIGESLIMRHLKNAQEILDGEAIQYVEKKNEKNTRSKLDISEEKNLSKEIKIFNEKNFNNKYFPTNRERLEHADSIINRNFL